MLFAACILGMVLLTLLFQRVQDTQRNPNRSPASTIGQDSIEVVLERNRYGHYQFSGTIEGHEVEFLVDTGASDVVIPLDLARALGLPFGASAQAMTANGVTMVYSTNVARLTIGDIELRDVRASINTGAQPGVILLGMSALRRIEFSQQGNRLTLRQVTHQDGK